MLAPQPCSRWEPEAALARAQPLPGELPCGLTVPQLRKPNCKLFTPEEKLGILVELAMTSPSRRSSWRRIGARKGPGVEMPKFPPGPAAAFLSPSPLCWSK